MLIADSISQGVRDLFTAERIPIEGACATSLAAMRQLSDELQNETVVFPTSGRNIDFERLSSILDDVA